MSWRDSSGGAGHLASMTNGRVALAELLLHGKSSVQMLADPRPRGLKDMEFTYARDLPMSSSKVFLRLW